MAKKIYISGKMGEKVLSQATKDKFARAEERLKGTGISIMNPASTSYQEALIAFLAHGHQSRDRDAAILIFDLAVVSRSDAIYMLRDWQDSPGAKAEYYYAKAIGIEILYEEE